MIQWNDSNVTFYIDNNPFGEIELTSTYGLGYTDNNLPVVKRSNNRCEINYTMPINRDMLMYLYFGHKVTNNWLKIHGGVMSRKRRRR